MLRPINALCGAAAALALAGIAPAQPAASPTSTNQPPKTVPLLGQPEANGAADPAPPDPARAMQCYKAVDEWVRRWQTPMDPVGQAPLPAAAVTLRYQGSVVGRGVAVASQPEGASGILMIATSRALNEARERMPIDHDALFDENLKAAAAHIAVTVEVAGRLIPIQPDQYADAVSLVAPGLEGVAVRIGDSIDAIFPETMLATGTDAAAAIRALVAKTSNDPALGLKEPKELREKNGAAFYRFKVTVVGQVGEGRQPEFFQRGGRVARLSELTEEGLKRWANTLAAHLQAQITSEADKCAMSGGLQPVVGSADPASPDEKALAALALFGSKSQGSSDAVLAQCICLAASALADTKSAADLSTQALVEATRCRVLMVNRQVSMQPAAAAFLRSPAVGRPERLIGEDGEFGNSVQGVEKGLLIYALSLCASMEQRTILDRAIRRDFRDTQPGFLVGQMPWLGWAEREIHDADDIPSAPALREMRSQLWAHQLQAQDLSPDDRDLAGGIVFSTNRQPLPTWQAARPLAFVATMLGDPRLTEDKELASETVRLLEALRYLRQLTAEEPEAHMYKDPARAIGGVRASVFDQRMPPEATAMTLMAVCETIKSLDEIKARQAAAAPK